jgi:hypothetical protein
MSQEVELEVHTAPRKMTRDLVDDVHLTQKKSYRFNRSPTLFWFPRNVNEWTARIIGLQVVVVCILAIIFRNARGGHYLVLGQMIEYILRYGSGQKT